MTGDTAQDKRREIHGGCYLSIASKGGEGMLSRARSEVREKLYGYLMNTCSRQRKQPGKAMHWDKSCMVEAGAGLAEAGEEEGIPLSMEEGDGHPTNSLKGTVGT